MSTSEGQENLSCMLAGAKDVQFVNRPVPQIEDPHDVLIKIAYTGVCGSDVSASTMCTYIRLEETTQ